MCNPTKKTTKTVNKTIDTHCFLKLNTSEYKAKPSKKPKIKKYRALTLGKFLDFLYFGGSDKKRRDLFSYNELLLLNSFLFL